MIEAIDRAPLVPRLSRSSRASHARAPVRYTGVMRPRSLLSGRTLRRGVAVGVVVLFVVRLTYFLFLDLADGRTGHVAERLFNEATGGLLAVVPLAGMAWLARRVPLV